MNINGHFHLALIGYIKKCSKISNTFSLCSQIKCGLSGQEFTKSVSVQTEKTLIRLLLQKQSDLGLHFLSRPFGRHVVFEILDHLQ